jgi:hypothetical protein
MAHRDPLTPPVLERQKAYSIADDLEQTIRFIVDEKGKCDPGHSTELPLTLMVRCGPRVSMVMIVALSYEKLMRPAVPWMNLRIHCRGRSPYSVVTPTQEETVSIAASLVATTIHTMLDDCMLETEDDELRLESFFGRKACFPATAKWPSQRLTTHQQIYDHLVTVFGFIGKIYG